MSREIPIIFNSDMVRAILAGQKTQTRRPVNGINPERLTETLSKAQLAKVKRELPESFGVSYFCPFGQPGDLLWVRETFSEAGGNAPELMLYRANYPGHVISDSRGYENIPPATAIKWRPSIHMPRWASRILLRVTAVRVERVQDITDAAAIAEGVGSGHYIEDGWYWKDWRLSDEEAAVSPMLESARESFRSLWESIYGNWDANPWVWVIEFERVTDSKREAA